jgi:hypothetical protein
MNPPVVPLQHQGYEHHGEVRRKPNHQGAEPHGQDCQAEHKPLRPGCIKQLSSGYLGQQAGNTADGQDKADVFWRPALTSEKERYERSKPGQSSPHKKIDCIERSTIQAGLLDLADLITDQLTTLHVATQLSQRVGRYWLVLGRAQIFKAPGPSSAWD